MRTGFSAFMSLGNWEGGGGVTHKSGDLLYAYGQMPREMVMIDTYLFNRLGAAVPRFQRCTFLEKV